MKEVFSLKADVEPLNINAITCPYFTSNPNLIIYSFGIYSGRFVVQYVTPTKKLDEKNGFKEFQIGDSFSKWQANLTFTNSNGENKYYTYTGSCCQQN